MQFRRDNTYGRKPGIDLTPILDTVFVLLIFFALSTTFMVTGAIDVNLPKATNSDVMADGATINVVITADNRIQLDGELIAVEILLERLTQRYGEDNASQIVIEADDNASHGAVVTVIDTARSAGFEKFAIATESVE